MVLQRYIPKSFCRDYVDIKGNSMQLGMFMATVLGIKPLMDEWIPTERIKDFRKICRNYGLHIRESVIFNNVAKGEVSDRVLGKQGITTTSAYGYPLNSGKTGSVHLFISKDKKLLAKGMWYPVIIKDRVINQPRIDGLKYGYVLGYPDCCIKFFRKYNNWIKHSYLYQAYVNTKGSPTFLCNPFLKNLSYSYIYHMPCSYSCSGTIKMVTRLRQEIKKREPKYVELTDRFLKMPFLVFYERKLYCFEGSLKGNEIKYKSFYFPCPDNSKDEFSQYLKQADRLSLNGRKISFFKGRDLIRQVEVKLNTFAPEYPFLISFE